MAATSSHSWTARPPREVVRPLWVLLAALALEGCAVALAPPMVHPHTVHCAPDGNDCLTRGREDFGAYRSGKLQEIRNKNQGYRLPSAPVAYLHPERTTYSVLLIHGLNDSSYYMADVGEVLYRNGFNVITVLLPGHGTDTRDMLEVTAEEWRAEVELGLEIASLVGRQILLGGFSLGGALALELAARRRDIQGLLLFSPAIRIRSFESVSALSCAPGLRSIVINTDLPPNPVKYKYRVGNSVCQLHRLLEHNLDLEHPAACGRPSLRDLARRVHVPTFIAVSYADRRISPVAILEFAGNIPAPVLVTTFGKAEDQSVPVFANGGKILAVSDASLPHSYLMRRTNPYNGQANPCFDRMAALLSGFLAQHFHSNFQRPAAGWPACGPIPGEFHSSE
ncbi:MAG: alpha/beta hydrolase [Gammaproteobacteria bacterium]